MCTAPTCNVMGYRDMPAERNGGRRLSITHISRALGPVSASHANSLPFGCTGIEKIHPVDRSFLEDPSFTDNNQSSSASHNTVAAQKRPRGRAPSGNFQSSVAIL